MLGYKMAAFKFRLQLFENVNILLNVQNIKVLDANRLEPRSGPIYVGPDLGYSLFAIILKY